MHIYIYIYTYAIQLLSFKDSKKTTTTIPCAYKAKQFIELLKRRKKIRKKKTAIKTNERIISCTRRIENYIEKYMIISKVYISLAINKKFHFQVRLLGKNNTSTHRRKLLITKILRRFQ